jgi:hypothetical protein
MPGHPQLAIIAETYLHTGEDNSSAARVIISSSIKELDGAESAGAQVETGLIR